MKVFPKDLITLFAGSSLLTFFSAACVTTDAGFEGADADRDGKLELNELETEFTKSLFEIGDTNQDGKLSPEEVQKADPDRPEWKFKENDTDGSGYLSYEELARVVNEEDTFDKVLKSLDANGDGIISKEEAKRLDAAMTAADRDQNLTPLERFFDQ